MLARTVNLLLGSWLFLSAFLWAHTPDEFTNTWLVGALCTLVAFAAVVHPPTRRWNLLLSAWLLLSTLALPHEPATAVHNAAVAVAIFALALVRTPGWHRPRTFEDRLREVAEALEHAEELEHAHAVERAR